MADDYERTTKNALKKLNGKSVMRIPTKYMKGKMKVFSPLASCSIQQNTNYKSAANTKYIKSK